MKVSAADLSRFRAWAVNSPEFLRLSRPERNEVRQALSAHPEDWSAMAVRYVEAGRRAFHPEKG